MITKRKLRERTVRIERAEVEGCFYKYRLSVKYGRGELGCRTPLYSISVELIDEVGKKTSASLRETFSDLDSANCFFNKLFENLATPIDLPYVFEDEHY